MHHLLGVLLLTGIPGAAFAEEAPTYAELLRRSVDRAPALLEQAANLRAARAEARQAHAWLNPSVGVEVENLGAPRAAGDASQRQTTLSVTQPFEIGGKRGARIAAGESNVRAAEARGRQAQIDYAAELAIAYATAEAAQLREQLAREDQTRAEEDLRAADALVRAGKEAQLRLEQARASVAAATAVGEAATADRIEALENLSALAGVADTYTSVAPSLLVATPIRSPMVGPQVGDAPAVAAAAAERDALAAQVRIERSRPIPDIGLSAGLRRFGGVGDTAFVVGVSATIPLFDRNRGNIAAAEERRTAAEARLEAVRLRANAARRSAQAQLTAADGRLKAATAGENASAEAYRLSRIGYDAGKASLVELLISRRALSDARALTVDARLARVRAEAALAQADGRLAFGD